MSVHLRKRKNADGSVTLRLDIYHNGYRTVETLKELKLDKPSGLADRENNKTKMKQAEAIAAARSVELEANNYSMVSDAGRKTLVTEWMQAYVDSYTKKDKRNMQGALNRFIAYLSHKKINQMTFGKLDALIIEDFMEFLEKSSTGEGALSYYSRFKKMIRHAFRSRLMRENVLDFVERKIKGRARKKDILTLEELKILSETSIENNSIKRAFLFTCVTGLRWVDIKALLWENIDPGGKKLTIRQSKTAEDVVIPLNVTALQLMGLQQVPSNPVFQLPSANGANKSLKAWVKRAGIDKKITWHNGRHSFGTNLIYNSVDILTASKLLGHTSLKHTERYVKSSMELKSAATDKLNIDLG